MGSSIAKADLQLLDDGYRVMLKIGGDWSIRGDLPDVESLLLWIDSKDGIRTVLLDLDKKTRFDSSLASFVFEIDAASCTRPWSIEQKNLPGNLRKLIELAKQASQGDEVVSDQPERQSWISDFGEMVIEHVEGALEIATFTGDWVIALFRLVRGKAKIRWDDFWHIIKTVSVDALPIVALISFLVGVIISFLGAVTLKQFGAEFAVAYLVGFGILREMGAIMTGIIMAGRSGAAFAAQIGSMKINEEIDALKTLGISPIEFIVLPRLLALFIMLPMLTLYSNVIGILSGWLVAEGLMGVPGPVFFSEMQAVVDTGDFLLGLFKACVFGILVSTAGCIRGLQSGSGADAVGVAATRAVVAGITLIVFSNAVIDWAAATIGI